MSELHLFVFIFVLLFLILFMVFKIGHLERRIEKIEKTIKNH